MTNSTSAAQFLRGEYGISGMQLQKILYYAQAMALITRAAPLFPEEFEAWRHGPINREVWQETGIPDQSLSAEEVAVLRAAWERYGHLTAYELSDLSHADAPWQEARRGLADGENCTRVISQGVMENFYLARELVQRADGTWEHQAPTEEEWQQAKLRLVLQRRKRGAHEVAHEQFLREQVVATQRLEGITVPAQYGG